MDAASSRMRERIKRLTCPRDRKEVPSTSGTGQRAHHDVLMGSSTATSSSAEPHFGG